MKKFKFLLMLFLLFSICAYSQTDDKHWKKKYLNIGFVNSSFEQEDSPILKSNNGASFTLGRTFHLHKNPIGGILCFGLDVTWLDLNYTNYKIKRITYWDTKNEQYHQGEVSIHIGPSITINPVGKLNIHGYFRYAPSISGLYTEDFHSNYATFFVGGASISYDVIGLGIESRFGNCEYKNSNTGKKSDALSSYKTQYNAWRAYLTFKF